MVEVRNLRAGYSKSEILHGVDFTANKGEITTVIGNNGCGKSTLLKTISGVLPIMSGEVRINGDSIASLSPSERAKQTAYLPQSKNTPDITVGRIVLHGRFPYLSYPRKYKKVDFEIADEAMKEMDVLSLSDKHMEELSGGTRQKVYIAMALAQRSPIIVMDEPTSYLDIGRQIKLIEIIKNLADDGKTIILSLHDLVMALKISDRIFVMENGRFIMNGAPEEILESGIIKKLYGIEVKTLDTPAGKQYYYEM